MNIAKYCQTTCCDGLSTAFDSEGQSDLFSPLRKRQMGGGHHLLGNFHLRDSAPSSMQTRPGKLWPELQRPNPAKRLNQSPSSPVLPGSSALISLITFCKRATKSLASITSSREPSTTFPT